MAQLLDSRPQVGDERTAVMPLDKSDPQSVRRAIELSATRYCSVGSTLSSGDLEVHHAYLIRTPADDDLYAEVVVTGPNTAPAVLAVQA